MNQDNTRKIEVIEQALQESVGGGMVPACHVTCHIFSVNVCDIDICDIRPN